MKPSIFKLFTVIAFGLWGLLVYSNSFHNSFHFDDNPDIINNAAIRNIHDLGAIWNFWPTRFIHYFSLALNYHWGKLDVVGYHVFSLLVHIGGAILVWQLAEVTLNILSVEAGWWPAFFSGMLFLVHPLQTQPVNYLAQRAVLLEAFFYLACLWLYARARLALTCQPEQWAWKLYYGGAWFMAGLAMFSKETAISLPFMVCFYEWYFFKDRGRRGLALVFLILLLVIPMTWLMHNPVDLPQMGKTVVEDYNGGMTPGHYFFTQLKVMVTYLRLLVFPWHQSVDYDYPVAASFFQLPVLACTLLLAGILAGAVKFRGRFRFACFGIFWFFITLAPASTLWPNKDVIFEHRLYLPMAGFTFFVTGVLSYVFKSRPGTLPVRILGALVLIYSFLTYQRNTVWADELSLWNDAVHHAPLDSRAYLNRGAAYQRQGNLDHALADYNMVISLGPVDAITLSNRGSIFMARGKYDLALANFNLAIKINPGFAGTYINRGRLYQAQGQQDLALADFDKAARLVPYDSEVYANRAKSYFLKHDYGKASQDFQKAKVLGARSGGAS